MTDAEMERGDEPAAVAVGQQTQTQHQQQASESLASAADDVPTPLLRAARRRPDARRESVAAVPSATAGVGRRDAALEDKRGRRKSWHPKFERKRRKGVVVPLDPGVAVSAENVAGEHRQKRPSWWNIFVPDHWPSRSRRASQDVGRVYRSAESVVPWPRSKSRSVDHGVPSSFDLEALRSKVEGRFESVEGVERRRGPPEHAELYTVADRDTLTSVAARFDTTPSELTKLNRLATPYIFPGQQLWVPRLSGAAVTPQQSIEGDAGSQVEDPAAAEPAARRISAEEERELLETLRPVSPKPGHAERVRTPLPASAGVSTDLPAVGGDLLPHHLDTGSADEETGGALRERFLKINVRHITDGQGVVGGVLLVTPNAVMFDPNVSDALVIEHGPESYGVIAPMEFVVNAAIYHDIAHMRVGGAAGGADGGDGVRPEVYHAPPLPGSSGAHSPGKDSLLVKDETFPELGAGADDADSVCSCAERDGNAFPKAFERDLVTPVNVPVSGPDDDLLQRSRDAAATDEEDDEEEASMPPPAAALEERRRSALDHHWAIPSKDRSMDSDPEPASPPPPPILEITTPVVTAVESDKQSCHDSGIDIREPPLAPLPLVTPVTMGTPQKKVYSDADIVLSSEWVPPVTIVPMTEGAPGAATVSTAGGRKKTSSVSFSLDGPDPATPPAVPAPPEPAETKKNKMLKRLSYPLAWMETFSSDREDDRATATTGTTGPPHSADQPPTAHTTSVFSKVFSSSPISLVDFGTGLFLSKTPSEDSGGSGGGGGPATGSPAHDASWSSAVSSAPGSAAGPGLSFFPTTHSAGSAGRSSVGTFMRQQQQHHESGPPPPRLDYRSMVSVEDMPELFVSFDKLIPRPARPCDDPPLYLRLRMGKPMGRAVSRSTPVMSYGRKKMRPEYWFSVPRNRVDDLYRFLQLWIPHLYGDLCVEEVRSRGFELVDSDTELWEDGSPRRASASSRRESGLTGISADGSDDVAELTRESWELIKAPYVKIYSMLRTQAASGDSDAAPDEVLSSEEARRALFAASVISLDVDVAPPDLVGVTEILTDEHRESLYRHLPARAEGYAWTLVFSTSQHGFSLNSMYRKMTRLESPVLLVIEDTDGNVFGALTSCALKVSDHFYGTGESLLFRFTPSFQVFNWTGENLYFIKGNNESLSIGAGDGKFGLWLDGDLNQGHTERCKTYANDPLTPNVDFVVKTLECWAFI